MTTYHQVELRSNSTSKSNRGRKDKDVCYRYNSGKCSFGLSCWFDHRCAVCNKTGHGAHNCRKLGLGKISRERTPGKNQNNGGTAKH